MAQPTTEPGWITLADELTTDTRAWVRYRYLLDPEALDIPLHPGLTTLDLPGWLEVPRRHITVSGFTPPAVATVRNGHVYLPMAHGRDYLEHMPWAWTLKGVDPVAPGQAGDPARWRPYWQHLRAANARGCRDHNATVTNTQEPATAAG